MGRSEYFHDLEADDDDASTYRDWSTILIWSCLGYTCLLIMLINFAGFPFLVMGLGEYFLDRNQHPFRAFSKNTGSFKKPKDIAIVGLIPFRDYKHTSILDCYLQRNLVHNNGFLDKIIFVPQTNEEDSLTWLDSTVKQTPGYSVSRPGSSIEWDVAEKGTMYIRIDGDVVFIEDNTIPSIVRTKLDHPNSLVVSANVIHQPALEGLHNHAGVVLPYLPELRHVLQPSRSTPHLVHDWRASDLPLWEGPADFKVRKGFVPPRENHRWLFSNDTGADRTPIAASMYTGEGPGWPHWTVSAQQHYSFLDHLERDDLRRYKFPLWKDPTDAVSRHFICLWGDDVIAARDSQDGLEDPYLERYIKGEAPRHVIIDGRGLVSHYDARTGVEGLDSTDLLPRYRAYAEEMVCLNTS